MVAVRFAALARRDLEDIRDSGVEDFGPDAGERHLDGFRRLFALLRDAPRAGEKRTDYGVGIRSLSHRPHRLLYRVDRDGVLIVRIIHHARDVRRALRDAG